tara:strand:- start:156 stop:731 length:576 start_codon:yes stop_codon:yes gene_type:complete
MKKLIYSLLAVSIIFAACKKEEENNNPPTPSVSIVGVWTTTSVDIDTSSTVTINGVVVDSLSGSGSITMTPTDADIFEEIEFTNNGKMFVDGDTADYTYSNNLLTVDFGNGEVEEVSCSFTATDLSITLEDNMDTAWTEMGMAITISVYWGQTIHCSRNTVINTNVSQRVRNTNHSWFVKPKIDNILKSIK